MLQRFTFSSSRSLFIQAAVFLCVFSITRLCDFSFLPPDRNPPVAMTHNALYLCITSSVPKAQKQLHLSDIYRRYSPPCAAFICQCSSLSLSRFLLLLLSLGLPQPGLNWRGPLGIGNCGLPPPTHISYSLSSVGLCALPVKNSGPTVSGINRC